MNKKNIRRMKQPQRMAKKEGLIMDSEDESYDPTASPRSDTEDSEPKFTESERMQSKQQIEREIELKNKIPDGITLYLDATDKTAEAREHYSEMDTCTYQNKQLGSSGQEIMTCVCSEDWDGEINYACSDEDCINRGTKVECISGEGSCGDDCCNQRLQKKEYASVTVIQTEKKGYGLRTNSALEPDSLVYEYIGEVIDEKTFKRRMLEYDELKLRHFYFMMLQKDEFIDATRRGSLGRFCNHSCNPNCYVEKWVVGDKLKMGIFAKRRILAGEELTFNYNVDRYGANAQPCYCGERNCIGFIGGKTQTDAASLLPQSISTALGSSIEDEQEFIKMMKEKGQKIKKTDNNINVEFLESLKMKEIAIHEIIYVMGALLQTEDKIIAEKLIERLELSSKGIIEKARYTHGFTSFGRLFRFTYDDSDKSHFPVDDSLVIRLLEIMENWTVSKDFLRKVHIIPVMEELERRTSSNEIREKCKKMMEAWSGFKETKKIAKRTIARETVNFDTRRRARQQDFRSESPKKDEKWRNPNWKHGWYATKSPDGEVYYYNIQTQESSWDEPVREDSSEKHQKMLQKMKYQKEMMKRQKQEEERTKILEKKKETDELQQIIEDAKRVEREKLDKLRQEELLAEEKRRKKEEYKLKKLAKGESYGEEDFKKRWSHLFAQQVPNMLKKYRDEIGIDNVKNCARDISKTLIDKEYKKDPTKKPLKEMDNDKKKKVKLFVESYMQKFLEKYRAKQKRKIEGDNGSRKRVHN
jgi:histone-lysine N-methyltransferase SETD2